ncbi:VOC family protein [Myxococcus llanfairpwllgwyngyllgogerychwyrndrobwllllantysiliogogogochensis]|uniref:VOC family protein n=1 Tax=Myxococcus llanfairpwllgwyngyllgogerychwyrndrobwllllantysiliogogogochensis TaxID=2590453 RepID=A0A540X524_9BACT|nr:VOC family protein [Myxococcus llanfairpwllgwyngyllgogerychwyrndrobwllllantysiliogogogochensis]TQF16340.1 VOC family protein [Myxococcus llanfairpwllgwyngyllgogerychwyrndrobwllllantysiliogogogochensis]
MPTVEKHAVGTPTWMDLTTPDLERSRAFYSALFGWTYLIGPEESGFYSMCQLNGRMVAGIGLKPKDAPYPTAWSVYFEADDVDAFVQRVEKLGGKVVAAPMDVFDAGRVAVCTDPTGASFGLWQSRGHKGAQLVGEPGTMAWHEVNTRDGIRAKDFYSALLGLEAKKLDLGMDYWTLDKGSEPVAGVLQMTAQWPGDLPPHWMNYFAVTDTDASVRKVTELGGKVHVKPTDSPYGRFSVVTDPVGAAFTLIAPSRPA